MKKSRMTIAESSSSKNSVELFRRSSARGIFVILAGLLGIFSLSAEPLDEEIVEFLQRRAPASLELVRAIAQEGEEAQEEAHERAYELEEMYFEAKEERGEEWAELILGLEEVGAEIELLGWGFEGGEIDKSSGEAALLKLLKKQIQLRNEVDRVQIEFLREELEGMQEEMEWRIESPEEALAELLEETLNDFGFGEREEEDSDEEWEEEEFEEDEIEEELEGGPVYQPAPAGHSQDESDLLGVTYDFGGDIRPTLEQYCFNCHDSDTAKGDIDLEAALAERPLVRNRLLWENVAERVKQGDMPPESKRQPSDPDRLKLRAWLASEIDHFDYSAVRNPGFVQARRLTREEYNRTIRDLVGLDLRPADDFPMDFSGTSGFSNTTNTLFLQTAHLDRYFTAAEGVIDAVQADPEAWAALAGKPEEVVVSLTRFLRRAYRRTPTAEERAVMLQRYQHSRQNQKSHSDALADTFKAVLVSPNFLLRVERFSESGVDEAVTDFDMASRLSYFLWASGPDSMLLDAAAAGTLSGSDSRRAQVRRMLADPRSISLGEIFAAEWLSTDDVGPRIRKDPIDNPWCTESLMAAMRAETAHFFHSLVSDNAPVSRLIDSDYTFLNAELARFYGFAGVEGSQMRRVAVDTSQRGGLFGHASVLAATSFPDRTSPVVRGKWILETLLGTPPPPPPPNVAEIEVADDEEGRRAAASLRRNLERHRESKQCAGCHSQIDPLGFALESYAEFGQWRSGVDNRGSLPNGAQFRGPAGLKMALIDTRIDDLGSQVIRKMLAYALGRQLEFYDEAVVRDIAAKIGPSGYRLGDLVLEITESYPFTTKRLPASH